MQSFAEFRLLSPFWAHCLMLLLQLHSPPSHAPYPHPTICNFRSISCMHLSVISFLFPLSVMSFLSSLLRKYLLDILQLLTKMPSLLGTFSDTPQKLLFPFSYSNLKRSLGMSLVAQRLRICLPMQGTRVRALVREDPTCRGATKPVSQNYWACTLEPASHNYWAHVPQLLKPTHLEPVLHNKRSHHNEKPMHRNEE